MCVSVPAWIAETCVAAASIDHDRPKSETFAATAPAASAASAGAPGAPGGAAGGAALAAGVDLSSTLEALRSPSAFMR